MGDLWLLDPNLAAGYAFIGVIVLLIMIVSGAVPALLAMWLVFSEKPTFRYIVYLAAVALSLGGPIILAHIYSVPPDYSEAFGFLPTKLSLFFVAVAPALRWIRGSELSTKAKIVGSVAMLLGLPAIVAWYNANVRIDPYEEASTDPSEAAAYYKRRCNRGDIFEGDGFDCWQLGRRYQDGVGVEPDPKTAAQLYERACDLADEGGCYSLGLAYAKGRGVPKDMARAAALYEEACESFYWPACHALGNLHVSGDFLARDIERATKLYQDTCNNGYPSGCTSLGSLYLVGDGVEKDLSRAYRLFERACTYGKRRFGQSEGCFNLGYMYANGVGVKKHLGEAESFFRKGCDLGLEEACQARAELESK